MRHYRRAEWDREVARHIAKFDVIAKQEGLRLCVRLDGSSDVGDAMSHASECPGVEFADYTKIASRMFDYLDGKLPPNRTVVWSNSSTNGQVTAQVLRRGGLVAMVFRGGLPEMWQDALGAWWYVHSGNDHDILSRHKGKRGILGLSEKGPEIGRLSTGGFVVDGAKRLEGVESSA